MKTLMIVLTMVISSQTFAAKCVISGGVQQGSSCHSLSTRLDVADVESCEAFAKATRENRFFNILEKGEILISAKYKFVDRPNRIKIKKKFVYVEEPDCF